MTTSKNNKILLGVVASCAAMTLAADGANIRYQTSGDWFQTVAADGAGWQAPGVPGAADNARANWGGNTITLSGTAPTINNMQIGVDESGTLEVNNGGILNTAMDVLAGNNGALATGTLTVNNGGTVNVGRILWAAQTNSTGFVNVNTGGTINVASHLWLGVSGTAEINIAGSLQQSGGILGLGTNNAVSASGGTATLNILDGGVLGLNNISGAAGQPSIQSGSILNIYGSGQLTVPGDFVGNLEGYASAGLIVGNDTPGLSNLQIDLTTNPGFTTVTAIPEPSAALLIGMLGAGAALRRRK